MYGPVAPRPKPTNILRTRTGCDSCRRRKKKCDEGKPACAACVRLGICCQVSKPSFEFVNGTPNTPGAHKRRTIQTRRSLTSDRVPVEDGFEPKDTNSPEIPVLGDDKKERIPVLPNSLLDSQKDPATNEKQFVVCAENISPRRAQAGIPSASYCGPLAIGSSRQSTGAAESLELRSLQVVTRSPSDQPFSSPPKEDGVLATYQCSTSLVSSAVKDSMIFPSCTTLKSQHSKLSPSTESSFSFLEAWFSSFVDLTVPDSNSLAYNSPLDWETHKVELGNQFFELQERLYLHHWRRKLLEILPPSFVHLESLFHECPALQPAVIALSAFDLAQIQTEIRGRVTYSEQHWFYAPNIQHQQSATVYYNIAKRHLARIVDFGGDKVSVLAVLLVFILIESRFGSFRGAAFHHHVIEHLLSSYYDICQRNVVGRSLMSSWIALRAESWSYRIPFTLFDFEASLREIGVDENHFVNPAEARAETVITNMLQSWRLSLMLLFERYTGRGDMESISSRCCRDVYLRTQRSVTQPWNPQIPEENYDDLLSEQRRKIDNWHAALPLSHQPIKSVRSESAARRPSQLSQFNNSQISQSCLEFQSQEAAMNYIYYAVARIVQSDEAMDEYLSMSPLVDASVHGHSQINQWLLIIIQTISSLDIVTCARQNFYSVGLLEIVKICHLRLPQHSKILDSLTDQLLEELTDDCSTYDRFPCISNLKHDFQEILEQRAQGKDLFYIMPRLSPDTQLQSNHIDGSTSPTMAYGRDRFTKNLFCKTLPARR